MGKLVSIVIPAYKAANYLAEAIDSALAQTYKNIEIIVVNDGSPDDGATREVALSYGDKIKYYEKENGGCASALNYGIGVMTGDYFSWLSHDDLYLPEKIESLLKMADEIGCDKDTTVLGCNDLIQSPSGQRSKSLYDNTAGLLSPEKAFGENLNVKTMNGCGLLIPKKVLADVGDLRTDYKHLLDRELWMRISVAGYNYAFIKDALVISRAHNQQITVKASNLLFDEETKMIDEYTDILRDKNPDFMRELTYFAYKRKHYDKGKELKKILASSGALNTKTRAVITKYTIEGKLKAIIRNTYKSLIRKR